MYRFQLKYLLIFMQLRVDSLTERGEECKDFLKKGENGKAIQKAIQIGIKLDKSSIYSYNSLTY